MRQPIDASGRAVHHCRMVSASVVADFMPLGASFPMGAFVSGSTGKTSSPVAAYLSAQSANVSGRFGSGSLESWVLVMAPGFGSGAFAFHGVAAGTVLATIHASSAAGCEPDEARRP